MLDSIRSKEMIQLAKKTGSRKGLSPIRRTFGGFDGPSCQDQFDEYRFNHPYHAMHDQEYATDVDSYIQKIAKKSW